MIRVVLPAHLRSLANAGAELKLAVDGPVTQRSVLDALESLYPVLRGTLRDHATGARRPYVRFFACEQDLSHDSPDAPLPEEVVNGKEPFLIVGAIAGGADRRRGGMLYVLLAAAAVVGFLTWMVWEPLRMRHETYRIGWEVDAPDQQADSNGQPTGLVVDIVRGAARRRGIKLQWIRHDESSEKAILSGSVDLWPLMTITPRRQKILHLSAPYLLSTESFIVLAKRHYRSVKDLDGATIAVVPLPIDAVLLHDFVPSARAVIRPTNRDLLDALCNEEVPAAFAAQDGLIRELLNYSSGCRGGALALITAPNSSIPLGIGSTKQAAAVADALREEIDRMLADGSLSDIFANWGFLSGHSVSAVESMVALRRRETWTRAVAAIFGALFVLAAWQTLRYRRESERARFAEAALRNNLDESFRMEQRLRLLAHALKSANDCICITDMAHRILFVNDALLRTYEYEESELIGKPVEILRSIHPDRALKDDETAAMFAGGWRGELWNQTKNGREVPVTLATSRVRDENGKEVAIVGVSSDITLRKQAEEEHQALQARYLQAQKLESVGRLAGGVAHDFNNLLTIINGYSRLSIEQLPPSDPSRARMEEIYNAGESAAALIRQLLAFSRKQVLQPRVIDLNQVVENTRPMLDRLLGESVDVRVWLSKHPAMVHADPHQLEQVIMNLSVNASDAMPGGGRLDIETSTITLDPAYAQSHPGVSPGKYVLLAVSDTGLGMAEDVRERIFEPFFTTKAVGQGTGLGLSIVQGIVAQSNGHIELYSEVGHGSTFKIYLPALSTIADRDAETANTPAPGGTETILVLEDRDEVRAYVAATLKEYGYRVKPAANAEEALEVCAGSETIDLILSDVVMPNISGPELVNKLPRPMKVLFMSGYTEKVIDIKTPSGKPVEFIEKPFGPEELAKKVRDVLGTRETPRRVLIADDEAGVRGFLRNALEGAGFEVVEAVDGKKAVEVVRRDRIDLAVIDLVMPEQEGIETMQEIRAVAPDVPLIAISGAFNGQFLKVAQAMGADAVLGKPFGADTIVGAVRAALKLD